MLFLERQYSVHIFILELWLKDTQRPTPAFAVSGVLMFSSGAFFAFLTDKAGKIGCFTYGQKMSWKDQTNNTYKYREFSQSLVYLPPLCHRAPL